MSRQVGFDFEKKNEKNVTFDLQHEGVQEEAGGEERARVVDGR